MSYQNEMRNYRLTESEHAKLDAPVPIIDIYGDITIETYFYVRAAVVYLESKGSPEVKVLISSPGGNVGYGLYVYDLLRLYKGKKVALVHHIAASMGALILQACDTRTVAKHSVVLIHHISREDITLDVVRSKSQLVRLRNEMERNQALLYSILSTRTGKTVSEIKRACAKDTEMSAEEALAFGLIDVIV